MEIPPKPNEPFALTRRYAVASLFGVFVAAIALVILYREMSINTILQFGEQANIAVAKTTVSASGQELVDYLQKNESTERLAGARHLPAHLLGLITSVIRDTSVVRIKIYGREGVVLYSNRESDIGVDDSGNPRLRGAIEGEVISILGYHDAFDFFARHSRDENLIETYVPVYEAGSSKPIGVFEIYTDVAPTVRAMTRSGLVVFLGIAVIMAILYSLLLYVVHQSDNLIARQRQTILERNNTLEVLSARMLAAEDRERGRIATELHEEILQSLSAAKLKVEAYVHSVRSRRASASEADEIGPLVGSIIRDIRALAMDLRPSILDDFGLLTTIRALSRDAAASHDQWKIETEIAVSEEDIPKSLKGIIFRILQETLKQIARTHAICRVRIEMTREDTGPLAVDFSAECDGPHAQPLAGMEFEPALDQEKMAAIWERAVLSGGSLRVMAVSENGVHCRAVWDR